MDKISIKVENVSKFFNFSKKRIFNNRFSSANSFQVLDNISFEVKKGEVLGIIGKNGSGKTTLLRIICGVYKPNSGSIEIQGRLSPLMQIGAGFQAEFTAKDNIISNGMLMGLSKNEIEQKIENIIQYAELEKFTDLRIKHYSSGMRSRLAFATAMQINPDILLVDEILSVGDKNFKEKSYKTFTSFKKENKTILFATHNLGNLPSFCDKVLLLDKGKVRMIGDPQEAIKKYKEID